MRVKLKKMELKNFKGIKSLNIPFSNLTKIAGDNGTGKTTILDGFLWTLFDKDSQGVKDFSVKPKNIIGEDSKKIETEVSLVLAVDGREVSFKKTMKEKWVKRRGSAETVLDGNEFAYSVDEVSMRKKDYKEKIEQIIDEDLFRLLTDPTMFNGLHWEKRREILNKMAGSDKVETELLQSKKYKSLEEILQNKSLIEYRKELASKKKKLNEHLKQIPARIDQETIGLPTDLAWESIKNKISRKEFDVKVIDGKLQDASKVSDSLQERILSKQERINELEQKRIQILNEESLEQDKAVQTYRVKVSKYESSIELLDLQIEGLEEQRGALINAMENNLQGKEELLEEWREIKRSELIYDPNSFSCPTCKRDYETSNIEEIKEDLLKNFNSDKSSKLQSISEQGKAYNESYLRLEREDADKLKDTERFMDKASDLEKELNLFKSTKPTVIEIDPMTIPAYIVLTKKIEELKKIDIQNKLPLENTHLQDEKDTLLEELKGLNNDYSMKSVYDAGIKRIDDLSILEKDLAGQVAGFERSEDLIESFTFNTMKQVETLINSKFGFVEFKMFETQLNGGVKEICNANVLGVPFNDLNSAMKINAGLEIIEVLSNYYSTFVPCFIDNAESVTDVFKTTSQQILLYVEEEYKELEISRHGK